MNIKTNNINHQLSVILDELPINRQKDLLEIAKVFLYEKYDASNSENHHSEAELILSTEDSIN